MSTPSTNSQRLSRLLRDSLPLESQCPPAEHYLQAARESLSARDRLALESHAATCPVCAAERDMARLFDRDLSANDQDADVIEGVLATLDQRIGSFPSTATEQKGTGSQNGRRALLQIAATLLFVIGLAGIVRVNFQTPPEIGRPSVESVRRGTSMIALGPEGGLANAPAMLWWERVQGADSYLVRILEIDGSETWQTKVQEASVSLPTELQEELLPAVRYSWTVEALDKEGRSLAHSSSLHFIIEPRSSQLGALPSSGGSSS